MRNTLRVYGTAALLGGVAVLFAEWRAPTLWKLATQCLAFGDWEGFCEMAAPGVFTYPGGALRYLATVLALSGVSAWGPFLVGGGVFVGALLLAGLLPELRRGEGLAGLSLPLFVLVGPLCLAGTSVWTLLDSALGWRNLLGLVVVAALIAGLRRVRARSEWMAVGAGIACALVLTVPCGLYVPIGVTLGLLTRRGAVGGLLAWGLYLAETSLLYADCSWTNGLLWGSGLCSHLAVTPLTVVNLFVFALLPMFTAGLIQWNWVGGVVPAVGVLALAAVPLSSRDVQVQFAAERAAAEGNWKGVLDVSRGDSSSWQMVTAWRLLAVHRLGEDVLAQLFDEPILANPVTSTAQEAEMDGYAILFGWGLLNATRCWIHQQLPAKDWQVRHFEVLGDRALLAGEWDLAYRKFAQLARVPFWGTKARTRLAFLETHTRGEVPEDLVGIAADARAFERDALKNGKPFFGLNLETEQLVIDSLLRMRDCPKRLLPAVMAAVLLAKRFDRLGRDAAVFQRLYTSETLPGCVREALEVLQNVESPRRTAFRRDLVGARSEADVEGLARKWGRSYYFYAECVK